MKIDFKQKERKSDKDKSLIKSFKSPAIMASGNSSIFSSSDPKNLCDRSKLLLQQKQAGNISNVFNDEIVAIVDKLLLYKCISEKQHKQILINCKLLRK